MKTSSNISYPDLPVARERKTILAALEQHQVIVVVGDTGSGKTTQLPKMALESAQARGIKRGRVGCTQPRRIAAASVAKRVAEEMKTSLGQVVGYQVRFQEKVSRETQLKFMTDGILLAETQGNADLRQYHTLIIDEAHERSLNIDFLLGYLNRLLPQRPDLKVIISSATLDAGGFANFFGNCPIIQVEGRTFPVEVEYFPRRDEEDLGRHLARAVEQISDYDEEGDILVFLPGEREIRECSDILEGRKFRATEICPLFARLGLEDQQRIFSTIPGARRIVLATNVAETSLTIPGIIYVIDSGLARISRWNPGRQIQRLQIEPVSQASANQRKGRCGRVSEGICLRLFEEEDFSTRDEFTDPEIRRSSLAGVILRMKSLGLPDIQKFPFIDPPKQKNISEGYRTLREIGALDRQKALTDLGRKLARIPVEPRLGRMLIEAEERDCLGAMLILVSGLTVMDPRERPAEKAKEADEAQAAWNDEDSDFLSYLHLWADLDEMRDGRRWKHNRLRKFCRQNFLNFRRILEWDNLRRELGQLGKKQLQWKWQDYQGHEIGEGEYQVIHECLLAGIPRQFGVIDPENKKEYKSAAGGRFAIFPGSGLFGKKKPDFLLAFEMVETTRLWARRVAKFDPAWIESVAPHLCRYSYHSPSWSRKQGAVYAKERVTSSGIPIVEDRRVHYGRIHSAAAREIFIRDGLLGDGLIKKPTFLKKIEQLREDVQRFEQKTRRIGLWHEDTVFDFLNERIPADMCTAKAFHKWVRSGKNEEEMVPSLEKILGGTLDEFGLEDYPDVWTHEGRKFPLHYRYAPGEADDGVTVEVALSELHSFPDWMPTWGVWGNLSDRVTILIRSLPKNLRIACSPVAEAVEAFVAAWAEWNPEQSLYSAIADFLSERSQKEITADDFDLARLPESLLTKIWIYDDETGEEMMMGTNLPALKVQLKGHADALYDASVGSEWEMSGAQNWDFGELPESYDPGGRIGFPGLVDEGKTVGLKLWRDSKFADYSHNRGCARLFFLQHTHIWKHFEKNPPLQLETRMSLPLFGESGLAIEEIGILAAIRALDIEQVIPRCPDSFAAACDEARGSFYEESEKLGKVLDQSVASYLQVSNFLEENRGDRNLAESMEDIDQQISWLLRRDFLLQSGWKWIQRYPAYFRGIEERINRINSQPLIKDIDKMDRIQPLTERVFTLLAANPEEFPPIDICCGLQELRLSVFAPGVPTSIKISAKRLEEQIAQWPP